MELNYLSLTEAAKSIRDQDLSPVELTQAHIDRINKIEPLLNCFITQTPQAALERARDAELEIKGGEYRGPLREGRVRQP